MAGALTVTLVGTYDNIEEAIVGWDAGTDTAPTTDNHKLIIEKGIGVSRHKLVKILKGK
jgi:hypothetical protein